MTTLNIPAAPAAPAPKIEITPAMIEVGRKKRAALDGVAKELFFGFERIDPTGQSWDKLDEATREMYRHALMFALTSSPSLVRTIIG